MPGFRYCSWCQGKGCICCDAEQKKWEKAETERLERHAKRPADEIRGTLDVLRALRDGTRPANGFIALAADTVRAGGPIDPAAVDAEIAKETALLHRAEGLIPDIPGWAADQFRYCPQCDGKGCPGCGDERTKFVQAALAAAPAWKMGGDIRDVRDAAVRAEARLAARGQAALTEDEIEEMFRPALDAEYKRQFPDGPKPIFSMRCGHPIGHLDVLKKAFGPEGGGLAEIEDRAAEARSLQALHDAAEKAMGGAGPAPKEPT